MGFRAPKGSQDYGQKWFVSLCQKPLWACAKSCLTLCDPMDCSLPGSSVQGFPRQESWSGLPCPPPGGSSWPRDQTPISYVSCIAGRFFTTSAPWEAHYGHSLCLIVCVCVCVYVITKTKEWLPQIIHEELEQSLLAFCDDIHTHKIKQNPHGRVFLHEFPTVSTKGLLSDLLRSPDWKANLCMKPGPQLNPRAIKLCPW